MASERNPRRDLRSVQDHVENEIIVLEVGAKGAITDLSEDAMGKVDTDYTLDLPHQVRTDSESSDPPAHGRVNRFIKIISATQPHIRIEPVIVSRDSLAQLRVEGRRQLPRDVRLGRANDSIDCRATSLTCEMESIYSGPQSRFFHPDKILNHLGNILSNVTAQRTDWNVW